MSNAKQTRTAVVCYEDRAAGLIGFKLLALSIVKYSPTLPVYFYTSEALMSDQLLVWLEHHAPNVLLLQAPAGAPSGWSIKPYVLIDALERGCDVAIWLDTDVMLNGSIEPRFAGLPNSTLSVASETGRENRTRATIWGFSVVRSLGLVVNTCVVRTTRDHLPLLREWARLTARPIFLQAQAKPLPEREVALYGDQDLLEGILISDALGEGQQVEIDFVRHDVDVAHGSRMAFAYCLNPSRRLPLFVHAHLQKPWSLPLIEWPRRRWLRYVGVELSPYVWVAKQYAATLENEGIRGWVEPQTLLGKCCDLLTASHPYMRMLPLQIIWRVQQRLGLT